MSDDRRGRRLRGDDRAGCIWRAEVATHTCDFGGDTALGLVERIGQPNENQDFVEEKFKELDSDQIEGGEFEF